MSWSIYNVTFEDTGDLVRKTAHPFTNGMAIQFATIAGTTGILINTTYYIINKNTDTFQVSTSPSGAAISLTTNGSGTLQYPYTQAKNAQMFYIVLQGVDSETDIGDSTKGVSRGFNVLGVEPIITPLSEPVKKIGGVIRASRVDITKLSVKFSEFKVEASNNDNDFTDYLYLIRQIFKKEYIAIVATDLTRGAEGSYFSSDYINMPIEPIEISKSAVYENGSDDLSIVFQERTIGSIS